VIRLPTFEKKEWQCSHCLCPGDKPDQDVDLCDACGMYYQIHDELPKHRAGLFKYTVN
jgi:hypothetical protein